MMHVRPYAREIPTIEPRHAGIAGTLPGMTRGCFPPAQKRLRDTPHPFDV